MRKGEAGNATKKKILSKDEIKLLSPLIDSQKVESTNLYKMANRVEKSQDAVTIIREYEEIIRTKNKNIIRIA